MLVRSPMGSTLAGFPDKSRKSPHKRKEEEWTLRRVDSPHAGPVANGAYPGQSSFRFRRLQQKILSIRVYQVDWD